jgi:hypothetical protein
MAFFLNLRKQSQLPSDFCSFLTSSPLSLYRVERIRALWFKGMCWLVWSSV